MEVEEVKANTTKVIISQFIAVSNEIKKKRLLWSFVKANTEEGGSSKDKIRNRKP